MVHYVMDDGNNRGEYRPAVVVKVWRRVDGSPPANGCVNLQVFTDGHNDYIDGEMVKWKTSRLFNDEEKGPGTWHWIEQA